MNALPAYCIKRALLGGFQGTASNPLFFSFTSEEQ